MMSSADGPGDELRPRDETAVAVVERAPQSIEGLIALAIEHGAAVEPLERLMAMRQVLKAESAREAFFEALSAFQAECPVIPKKKTAGAGSYTYRYAPLDVIVAAVSPILRRYGLSYRFDTRFEADPPAQVVVCTVHHREGHSESSEFRTPVDASARMNDMQKSASAQTYAKRYAFCNAFGILTGDEDDDGRGGDGADSSRVSKAPVVAPATVRDSGTSASPRPVGRNLVPLRRQSSEAQGSDELVISRSHASEGQPTLVAETPAPSTSASDPLADLRQEIVERAAMLEVTEIRQSGKSALPEAAVMARARLRCDATLGNLYSKKLETASRSELESLCRVIDHKIRKANETVDATA